MKLSIFLRADQQLIINEWALFARTLLPAAAGMSDAALRDHAAGILRVISLDMETSQSHEHQQLKSQGKTSPWDASEGAASIDGAERHAQGFSLSQVYAEYRALRATVMRLWLPRITELSISNLNEMVRFNESIDQALAESLMTYSRFTDHKRDVSPMPDELNQ
jgi:hypothetical protein